MYKHHASHELMSKLMLEINYKKWLVANCKTFAGLTKYNILPTKPLPLCLSTTFQRLSQNTVIFLIFEVFHISLFTWTASTTELNINKKSIYRYCKLTLNGSKKPRIYNPTKINDFKFCQKTLGSTLLHFLQI